MQAETFLLDAHEFYPFGTYINMEDEIIGGIGRCLRFKGGSIYPE